MLGALLSLCCATARPINSIQELPRNNVSDKSDYFIKEIVLKKSLDSSKNNSKNMGHEVLLLSESDKIILDKSPTTASPSQSSSSTTTTTVTPTTPQWTFNTLFSNNIKDDRAGIGDDVVVKGESIKNSVRSNRSSINVNHDNAVSLVLLSRGDRSVHVSGSSNNTTGKRSTKRQRDLERNERSANLSHITGATRKIQLYIKNRFLQILPDGTVNGTHDDTSDYSK